MIFTTFMVYTSTFMVYLLRSNQNPLSRNWNQRNHPRPPESRWQPRIRRVLRQRVNSILPNWILLELIVQKNCKEVPTSHHQSICGRLGKVVRAGRDDKPPRYRSRLRASPLWQSLLATRAATVPKRKPFPSAARA